MKFGLSQLAGMVVLRRFVAALCAVAFLSVGFAHLTHHADFTHNAVTVEKTNFADTLDKMDDADPAKKVSVLEHCHGCMMVAIETAGVGGLPALSASTVPQLALRQLRAVLQRADSPPPRA